METSLFYGYPYPIELASLMVQRFTAQTHLDFVAAKRLIMMACGFPLDPRVVKALCETPKPVDASIMDTLLLEWPHISVEQGVRRIAYLRDPLNKWRDGDPLWTTTKPGAYLARVFPELTGRQIELIVQFAAPKEFALVTDARGMMDAIIEVKSGSCMGGKKFPDDECHPMRVYRPDLGWSLAVRYTEDMAVGRALVYTYPDGRRRWVRSYTAAGNDSALEDWLVGQGIERASGWHNAEIAAIPLNAHEYVAPYLDGAAQEAELRGKVFVIGGADAAYSFDNTGGRVTSRAGQVQLSDGDWVDEDEAVTLHDGTVVHQDDASYVARYEDYYANDDVVYCEDSGECELYDECVRLRDHIWAYESDAVEITAGSGRGSYVLMSDTDAWVELYDGEVALTDDAVCIEYGPHEGDYVLEKDSTLDWAGRAVLACGAVKLTRGAHAGKWALECDTTRCKGGEIVLTEEDADRITEDDEWVLLPPRTGRRYTARTAFAKVLRADLLARRWAPLRVGYFVRVIGPEARQWPMAGSVGQIMALRCDSALVFSEVHGTYRVDVDEIVRVPAPKMEVAHA